MTVTSFSPKFNGAGAAMPTASDDESMGYFVGSIWVDTGTNCAFMCVDSTTGSAAWIPIRNDVISTYDNAGGQTFTGTITINLDTVKANTNSSIFSLATDVITVNANGSYAFSYDCTLGINTGSNARSQCQTFLEVDTGGGFVEVDGSRAATYNRNLAQGQNTSSMSNLTLSVAAGDQFRLRATRISGSSTIVTIADGSRLSVMRVS